MADIEPGGTVDFDFGGSLDLARTLWSLAEDLEAADGAREGKSATALTKWKGPYATQFTQRRADERTSAANVAEGLRDDARSWAAAWVEAMHQQNKNNRAAQVEQVREDRWWGEKAWDATLGEDESESKVAAAERPSTPQPPSFQPTATLQVF